MPTSLARTIRRIGLLPSTFDDKGKKLPATFDETVLAERDTLIAKLRTEAKERRELAFAGRLKPSRQHRRSKSRAKADKTK